MLLLPPAPLPASDEFGQCYECGQWFPPRMLRRGEDDERYCGWCYDATRQDPGALQGIDPEN